jgi:hypothetical protein
MSRIVLQPAGDKDANQHYQDTILNPVPIDKIKKYVGAELYSQLLALYPDKKIPTWGATPGTKNVNVNKWKKLESGDITLFARKKIIFASGVVTLKTHNKDLALDLWGSKAGGETWEYVYFLDEIKGHDISYKNFNKVAGYAENNIIQGFNVLDDEKSESIIQTFELRSDTYMPPVSVEDFKESVDKIKDITELDKQITTSARKEQTFLRNYLFGGKVKSNCSICNEEFPVSFLVAAHIKKRSECSEQERKDYKYVVAPMCKFGCDELYEKGFIGVENGKVIRLLNSKILTDSVNKYIVGILGNKCSDWNSNTEKYFNWHNELSRVK